MGKNSNVYNLCHKKKRIACNFVFVNKFAYISHIYMDCQINGMKLFNIFLYSFPGGKVIGYNK